MKIDESSINHNALLLIADELSLYWDGNEADARECMHTIGGIIEMANAMKEVLGACKTK